MMEKKTKLRMEKRIKSNKKMFLSKIKPISLRSNKNRITNQKIRKLETPQSTKIVLRLIKIFSLLRVEKIIIQEASLNLMQMSK